MDLVNDLARRLRENVDPRTKDLPLVNSPWMMFGIIGTYLAFVKIVGPNMMEKRKPFQLTTIMTIYNAVQVVVCVTTLYWFVENGVLDGNPFICKATDYSYDKKPVDLVMIMWYSILIKMLELFETVMFTLRKKQNQVSYLHVYHHISTLFFTWTAVRYSPGGVAAVAIALNTFIHILMYLYYLMSVHASEGLRNKLIAGKKCLTMLQMIQFWMMAAICVQTIFIERCSSLRYIAIFFVPNILYIFYLFRQFFIRTYYQEGKKKAF